jgi:hypothetical protein
MEGKGSLFTGNGIVFEGSFRSNLKHGAGKIRYPDGKEFEEIWEDGILVTHQNTLKYV